MLWLFVLIVIACSAIAQRPVLNNDNVDKTMAWHNDMLSKGGYGLTALPNLDLGWLKLSNGVQVGMNSLYRTGDCYAWKVGTNSVFYSNKIGYRLLAFAFGSISVGTESFSGILRVRENSLQFDYTVHNDSRCYVTLDQYRFTEFADLEFVSSSPKYSEGVVAEDVFGDDSDILSLVNGLVGGDRQGLEDHLQPLCGGHPSTTTEIPAV